MDPAHLAAATAGCVPGQVLNFDAATGRATLLVAAHNPKAITGHVSIVDAHPGTWHLAADCPYQSTFR